MHSTARGDMTPLRILITGNNGTIGRVLIATFQDRYDLYGLDRAGPFSDRVACANIAEYRQVAQVIQHFSPLDCIIHLAGDPRVEASWESVLVANIAGVSKAFGEAVARYYCARWGIEAICLRIGAVLSEDDPTSHARLRKVWLSHRDLIRLVEQSLIANVNFGMYYGISNNKGAFWDITNAESYKYYGRYTTFQRCTASYRTEREYKTACVTHRLSQLVRGRYPCY